MAVAATMTTAISQPQAEEPEPEPGFAAKTEELSTTTKAATSTMQKSSSSAFDSVVYIQKRRKVSEYSSRLAQALRVYGSGRMIWKIAKNVFWIVGTGVKIVATAVGLADFVQVVQDEIVATIAKRVDRLVEEAHHAATECIRLLVHSLGSSLQELARLDRAAKVYMMSRECRFGYVGTFFVSHHFKRSIEQYVQRTQLLMESHRLCRNDLIKKRKTNHDNGNNPQDEELVSLARTLGFDDNDDKNSFSEALLLALAEKKSYTPDEAETLWKDTKGELYDRTRQRTKMDLILSLENLSELLTHETVITEKKLGLSMAANVNGNMAEGLVENLGDSTNETRRSTQFFGQEQYLDERKRAVLICRDISDAMRGLRNKIYINKRLTELHRLLCRVEAMDATTRRVLYPRNFARQAIYFLFGRCLASNNQKKTKSRRFIPLSFGKRKSSKREGLGGSTTASEDTEDDDEKDTRDDSFKSIGSAERLTRHQKFFQSSGSLDSDMLDVERTPILAGLLAIKEHEWKDIQPGEIDESGNLAFVLAVAVVVMAEDDNFIDDSLEEVAYEIMRNKTKSDFSKALNRLGDSLEKETEFVKAELDTAQRRNSKNRKWNKRYSFPPLDC